MKLEGHGKLLRIYTGENARWQGRLLYEAVVLKARERGLAGATVLRGRMGFGARSRIHTTKVLRLSEDLPIVVQIIDTAENIEAFLPEVKEMVSDGLITIEDMHIIQCRPDPPRRDS
jgi:hypothetical protein